MSAGLRSVLWASLAMMIGMGVAFAEERPQGVLSDRKGVLSEAKGDSEGHPAAAPADPAKVFDLTKRHIYTVRWLGVPIGIGTMEVVEITKLHGRDVYHIKVTGRSNDFFSRFTPVQDEIHTYLDAERLVTLRSQISQHEGGYRAEERVDFDHAARKGRYESFVNGSVKEFEVPEGVKDALGGFYYFRLQPMQVGDTIQFPVNVDEKNWDIRIQVVARESLEMIKRGVYEAVLVEPDAIARNTLFRRRVKRAQFWLTADDRRLPLLAKLWLHGFGFISAAYDRSEPREAK